MSYHILHILQHGCSLRKDSGMLVCKNKSGKEKKMPLEDIRAVIIAAKGTCLTDQVISALIKNKAIIVHCDEQFNPLAITVALSDTLNKNVVHGQLQATNALHKRLWREILSAKVQSQADLLKLMGSEKKYLFSRVNKKDLNESSCAAFYWREYFTILNRTELRRRQEEPDPVNDKLNYGYAVLSSLCHRSIAAHGLNPSLGIHHKINYRSHPLVYDLMEPLRAQVDKYLWRFEEDESHKDMTVWCRYISRSLSQSKVAYKGYSLGLLEAIDIYIQSLAQAFSTKSAKNLWIPKLKLKQP